MAWGTKLRPIDQLEHGQWSEGDEEMLPIINAARAKYRDKPLILRAVEASAHRWGFESADPSAESIVRVSTLSFSRAFSGDRVLEVSRDDVPRVLSLFEDALVRAERDAVLRGPVWRMRFRRANTARWSEDDDGGFVIDATPQVIEELSTILRSSPANTARALASLEGVAVRW